MADDGEFNWNDADPRDFAPGFGAPQQSPQGQGNQFGQGQGGFGEQQGSFGGQQGGFGNPQGSFDSPLAGGQNAQQQEPEEPKKMGAGKRTAIIAGIMVLAVSGVMVINSISVGMKEKNLEPAPTSQEQVQAPLNEGGGAVVLPPEGVEEAGANVTGNPGVVQAQPENPTITTQQGSAQGQKDLPKAGQLLLTTVPSPSKGGELIKATGFVEAKHVATDQNGQYYFVAAVLLAGEGYNGNGKPVNVVFTKETFDSLEKGAMLTLDINLTADGGVIVQKVDRL